MGDVPRILNMYVLISFVVSRLSFVLVTDLMRKKKKKKNYSAQSSAWD